MSNLAGGCLCGAIRYELSAEPAMVAACHCKNCQKQTGTAYSVIVGVPEDSVTLTNGTLKTYQHMGTSGMPVHRNFCGDCGSPIHSKAEAIAGILFVKGGTLDDTSTIDIGAEIWCGAKSHWSELAAELPEFPGNPPG